MKNLFVACIAAFSLYLARDTAWGSTDQPTSAQEEIENQFLTVRFDSKAETVTITDRATGMAFVKDLQLEDAGSFSRDEAANDPVFGAGRRIVIARASGGEMALEVYPGLPFALVRGLVINRQSTQADIQHIIPAAFTIDLGKPAAQLKTLGTGGLLPADKNPGSYMFLTVADPLTRDGVVTGWLTQDRGSGVVFSEVKDDTVRLKAQIDYGHLRLAPGQSAKLETLAIGLFKDARLGEESFADAVKKQYAIQLRKPDAVYCTWYSEGRGHGAAGNEKNTLELSHFIARELKPYGLGVIQIDDHWQSGPQIGGPATEFGQVNPNGPYAHGMAPVAAALKQDGITLGLWWLPFGRNHMAPQYKDRQDWFVKRPDGSPLRQHSFGGTCLDSTNPAVQTHLETLARTMRGWGVTYFKMDGLSDGAGVDHVYINDGYKDDKFSDCAPLHDPMATNIDAMRLGLKSIRKGAGDDVYFSGCCASQNMRIFAGSVGLVDSMRVGPDFNHDGQGIKTGPLRASRLYFLNGRVWWNDPDPSKVRASGENCEGDPSINGAVTLDQARLTTSWVSLSGQFFLVSDWLPNLPQDRLEVLKRTLAHHGGIARPVDSFDRTLPNTWLVTDYKSGVRRATIGVFNFDATPLVANYTLDKLGLDSTRTYHAFDFWQNIPLPDIHADFTATAKPAACRVISVRAVEDHPVLISTSRHVSSGILEVKEEKWSHNLLSGISDVIANDPYELRIVGLRDGGKQWVPANVAVSDEDRAAGVSVSTTLDAGLLRVKIIAPTSRAVKWFAAFSAEPLQPATAGHLKAAANGPYDPVLLTWTTNAPFHTISRDGRVIATGCYGQSYSDNTASRGQFHTYSVAVDGQPAASSVSIQVPGYPAVPPLPDVKVDDLKPVVAQNGWGKVQAGKAIDGGPLTVGGKVCAHGLGLHAPALYFYIRDPGWKRFVANIGLNETQRQVAATTVVCKVIAEDAAGVKRILISSPLMQFNGVEHFPVNVALPPDCAKVNLVVDDGGDGNRCDHTNWGDAGFLK